MDILLITGTWKIRARKSGTNISSSIDKLLKDPEIIIERLNKGFEEHLARSIKNPIILKEFIKDGGWDVSN